MRADLDNAASAGAFRELFVQGLPLLDVRAPLEFSRGAFPGAKNLPLLDNEQRHLIGCEYAAQGQQAAMALGERMANAKIRAQRLTAWRAFIEDNAHGYLYCFRGGLRSHITQQWLREQGCDYPLIVGGYKALRRYLLDELRRLCEGGLVVVLAGKTGSGKTEILQSLSNAIDLEGHARHRGSAFGKTRCEQPTQIDWEHALTIDWLRKEHQGCDSIVLEAESRLIGRLHLPLELQELMRRAPVVMLEVDMAERIQRLKSDYIDYFLVSAEPGNSEDAGSRYVALQEDIATNLGRIRKRLGERDYKSMLAQLPEAISSLQARQCSERLENIIAGLLEHYYDKSYSHAQQRQARKVIFTGDYEQVQSFLRARQA